MLDQKIKCENKWCVLHDKCYNVIYYNCEIRKKYENGITKEMSNDIYGLIMNELSSGNSALDFFNNLLSDHLIFKEPR